MSEFEREPIRGLPERLPRGEHLLWQGALGWISLAVHAFHVRAVVIYFGILLVWRVVLIGSGGASLSRIVVATLPLLSLGLACIAILAVLAWLAARATVYSITSQRVVIRFGVALPITLNVPFRVIAAAAVKRHGDGTGSIPLSLSGSDRVAYLVLWPHARPWRIKRPEPMLRCVPDVEHVAQVLARAVTAATNRHGQPSVAQLAQQATPAAAQWPAGTAAA